MVYLCVCMLLFLYTIIYYFHLHIYCYLERDILPMGTNDNKYLVSLILQVRLMHKKLSARCRKSTTSVQEVPVLFSLITMVAYVFLGAAIFCTWENWTVIDASYFCFITLTTVGFGDIVPDVYKGRQACQV